VSRTPCLYAWAALKPGLSALLSPNIRSGTITRERRRKEWRCVLRIALCITATRFYLHIAPWHTKRTERGPAVPIRGCNCRDIACETRVMRLLRSLWQAGCAQRRVRLPVSAASGFFFSISRAAAGGRATPLCARYRRDMRYLLPCPSPGSRCAVGGALGCRGPCPEGWHRQRAGFRRSLPFARCVVLAALRLHQSLRDDARAYVFCRAIAQEPLGRA